MSQRKDGSALMDREPYEQWSAAVSQRTPGNALQCLACFSHHILHFTLGVKNRSSLVSEVDQRFFSINQFITSTLQLLMSLLAKRCCKASREGIVPVGVCCAVCVSAELRWKYCTPLIFRLHTEHWKWFSVTFQDLFICVFQDFPGQPMSTFHVFPGLLNRVDIKQVRLSYNIEYVTQFIISVHNRSNRLWQWTMIINVRKGQKHAQGSEMRQPFEFP